MLFCCCGCWVSYVYWSKITADMAQGCIPIGFNKETGKYDVNVVTVTGGPIVSRGFGVNYLEYGSAFRAPFYDNTTYKWPCETTYQRRTTDYRYFSYMALNQQSSNKTYTVYFSKPVTEIFMPIISLGAYSSNVVDISVTWRFISTPIRVISTGPHESFAECPDRGNCLRTTEVGNYLIGREGSGIVQIRDRFSPPISQFSFEVVGRSENWNGFSFGIPISEFANRDDMSVIQYFPPQCQFSYARPPWISEEKTGRFNPLP